MGGVAILLIFRRRPKLSRLAEKKLVRMIRYNPGTIKSQTCHEAAKTLSTVKQVLQHTVMDFLVELVHKVYEKNKEPQNSLASPQMGKPWTESCVPTGQ